MKEEGEKATTLFELTEATMGPSTYSEARVRLEALAGQLTENVCAYFCCIVAERELGRNNIDGFVEILMPRHLVGADLTEPTQCLLDVEHPLMHMWAPPVNFEEVEAPDDSEVVAEGSPADRQRKKHAAWKTWRNGFSERTINAWSSDTIMGY